MHTHVTTVCKVYVKICVLFMQDFFKSRIVIYIYWALHSTSNLFFQWPNCQPPFCACWICISKKYQLCIGN